MMFFVVRSVWMDVWYFTRWSNSFFTFESDNGNCVHFYRSFHNIKFDQKKKKSFVTWRLVFLVVECFLTCSPIGGSAFVLNVEKMLPKFQFDNEDSPHNNENISHLFCAFLIKNVSSSFGPHHLIAVKLQNWWESVFVALSRVPPNAERNFSVHFTIPYMFWSHAYFVCYVPIGSFLNRL